MALDPKADGAIVVTVEGGMIQDIEQIPPGVKIRVVDFDIEGSDDVFDTTEVVDDDGKTVRAVVSEYEALPRKEG